MVLHSDVFERFTQGDTIPVMTQAVMEKALSPSVIDQLFEDVAERQYTRDILFSSVVELMSLVVCGIQPSINAAYTKNAVPIDASLQALYGKIGRMEPAVARRWSAPPTSDSPRSSPPPAASAPASCPAIAPRSSTATTCPGPSTASWSCAPSGPRPCPATPWSSSTRSG